MSKSKMSLNLKLLLMTLVLTLTSAVMVVYSNFIIRQMSAQIEIFALERIPITSDRADVGSFSQAIPFFLWQAIESNPGSHEREQALVKVEESTTQLDKALQHYLKLSGVSEETRNRLVEIQGLSGEIKKHTKEVIGRIAKTQELSDPETKKMMLEHISPKAAEIVEIVDNMREFADAKNEKMRAEAQSVKEFALWSMALGGSLAMIFAFIFGYFFSRSVSRSLTTITNSVDSASSHLSTASASLFQTSENLTQSAQKEASAIQQTSASLTEISGMAEANVRNAEQVNTAAQEVYDISEQTQATMDRLGGAMAQILESNARIEQLVKTIELIGEKTEVIDSIVFKTGILSFNASVEAERAGEHGRGFSVVAQEVGNLAQLSGEAAKEISQIVNNTIREASQVATENKERVQAGGVLANETRGKMGDVLKQLSDILSGITKIVEASKEQGQGIGQISQALEALNHETQKIAGTSEEAVNSSAKLSEKAEVLQEAAWSLREIVTGNRNEPEKPAETAVPKSKASFKSKHGTSGASNVVSLKAKKPISHDDFPPEFQAATGTDDDSGWEKL